VSTFRLARELHRELVVAVTAPVLGAIADRGGHAKRFLVAAALFGAAMVAGAALGRQGRVAMGRSRFYVLASLGYFWAMCSATRCW